ncbi:MAG: tetratricopeptide repeat protein [Phycisphaerales bacterium]|nr:tetratricopeptide repeat protein [Phycisphaerales bacterium]
MDDWLDAEQLATSAIELLEHGRWSEAEAQLRRALSIDPGQSDWRYHLGLVLEAQGRDREARDAFDQSIQAAPDPIDAMLASAMASGRLGDWPAAASQLTDVIALEPGCESAHARLIEAHARQEAHDDAETAFYMAEMALGRPSADCLAQIGASLAARGSWRRASWCLRQALRLDPELPQARRWLADVLASTGQVQRAVELYEQELREDPDSLELLMGYASLLERLGRLDEAAARLRRALDVEPTSVEANHRLGLLALRAGRMDQAAVAFQLVLRLDRGHPTAARDLAAALLAAGQKGDARRLLGSIVQRVREAEDDGCLEPEASLVALVELLIDAGLPIDAAERIEVLLARGLTPDVDLWRRIALARFQAGDVDGGRAASRRVLRHEPACLRSIGNLAWASLLQGRLKEAGAWIRRGLKQDRDDDRLKALRTRLWVARFKALLRR